MDKSLIERVEKLEMENRLLKLAALLVILILFLTAQSKTNRTVESTDFVLRDSNGTLKGEWSVLQDGDAALLMFSDKGTITLDTAPVAHITLAGSKGESGPGPFSSVYAGVVSVRDKAGASSIQTPEAITVQDKSGFRSVMGSVSTIIPDTGETHRTSAAALTMFDKHSKVIWQAP